MPVAELVEGRIALATEYREKELVKLVPGSKWDTAAQSWWCPLSWASCVQLRGVFGAELQVGQNLAAWVANELETRIRPCLDLRTATDAEDLSSLLTVLKPFQRAGVKFLATAKRGLIADEMGLGKSAQAIAALEISPDSYPALVVCPNSMKFAWAEEFSKWAPGRRVVVIDGGAVARRKQIALCRDGEADVLVVNWEGLRSHTRLAGYGQLALDDKEKEDKELNEVPFRTCVADEAHKAKDPRSKQTRALWAVSADCEYRFGLTGTPIANSPEDAWSLMRFLEPAEFPGKTKFIERYGAESWNVFGFMSITGVKPDTAEELFKIIDPRFTRRLKAAVMPELPPKTYATRYVQMGAAQKKAYEQMRKEMLVELDGGILLATNPLMKTTRLVQFASASGKLETSPSGEEKLILTAPSCKVEALEEIAAELGGASAIVFAESRQLIELATARLLKDGYKVCQITGGVPAYERQQNVAAFQAGDTQFIMVTLGAGGEGLTLTAAKTEIFLQRSWSAIKNAQAEDRAYGRISDAHGVNIIDIITQGTIEERVHEVRKEKGDIAEEILRDEATLKAWLSK